MNSRRSGPERVAPFRMVEVGLVYMQWLILPQPFLFAPIDSRWHTRPPRRKKVSST